MLVRLDGVEFYAGCKRWLYDMNQDILQISY